MCSVVPEKKNGASTHKFILISVCIIPKFLLTYLFLFLCVVKTGTSLVYYCVLPETRSCICTNPQICFLLISNTCYIKCEFDLSN